MDTPPLDKEVYQFITPNGILHYLIIKSVAGQINYLLNKTFKKPLPCKLDGINRFLKMSPLPYPWRHRFRLFPFKVARGYGLTCQYKENWRQWRLLIGPQPYPVGQRSRARKKNRNEKDLVTERFEKYNPSRVTVEGLGKNFQIFVNNSDLWQFEDNPASG